MKVQFLLDTDHVSLFQRHHPQVVARILACPPTVLAVTVITMEEQLQGRLAVIRRARTEHDVTRGYARLGEALAFFQAIPMVLYAEDAAARFTALRQQGIRIGTQDLRIAAIALSVQATVVTRNQRDFGQIPGLLLEDWSV